MNNKMTIEIDTKSYEIELDMEDEWNTPVYVLQDGVKLLAGSINMAYGDECAFGSRPRDEDEAYANGMKSDNWTNIYQGDLVETVHLSRFSDMSQEDWDAGEWDHDAEEKAHREVLIPAILRAWNGQDNRCEVDEEDCG